MEIAYLFGVSVLLLFAHRKSLSSCIVYIAYLSDVSQVFGRFRMLSCVFICFQRLSNLFRSFRILSNRLDY